LDRSEITIKIPCRRPTPASVAPPLFLAGGHHPCFLSELRANAHNRRSLIA
jgi:hypothetical protein